MQQQKHNPRKRRSKLPVGKLSRERGTHSKQFHPAGEGGPRQNAGGPDHRGIDANEDRNP